jgi:hypothetical protein
MALSANAWTLGASGEPAILRTEGTLELGDILYQIDFVQATPGTFNDPQWKGVGGTFDIKDGQLHVWGEKDKTVLTLDQAFPGNLVVRCPFRQVTTCPSVGLGLFDAWRVVADGQTGKLELRRTDEAAGTRLETAGNYPSLAKDPDHLLTVLVSEDTILVWLDAAPALACARPQAVKDGRLSLLGGPLSSWIVADFGVYRVKAAPKVSRVTVSDIVKGLPKGLTAYLPFDGNLAVKGPEGGRKRVEPVNQQVVDGKKTMVPAPEIGFELGYREEGVCVDENHSVMLRGWGLFESQRGTIAFWFNPSWSAEEMLENRVLLVSGNFRLLNVKKDIYQFTTSASQTTVTTRGLAEPWEPDGWHHAALTWDGTTGEKALYLDGRLAASGRNEPIDRYAGFLVLGSPLSPGMFDEWMVWNRILGPLEIQLLAQGDDAVWKVFQSVPLQPYKQHPPIQFEPKVIAEPVKTVVAPGETYVSPFLASNNGDARWEGDVRFTLLDYWERPRATQTMKVALNPEAKRELAVAFTPPECGVFKVSARIEDGDEPWEIDVSSFAAWPGPAGPPDPTSFFGNHITAWEQDGRFLAQGARLGLGWNRDHNMTVATWWPNVEPEPGEFKWLADHQIENHRKYKMPVLGQFMGTPYWAAANGPLKKQSLWAYPYAALPKLDKFRTYVFETVKHYKDYIHHWEVWNEPHTSVFWHGSPEQYAEYALAACEEAKRADPDCAVMVGALSGRIDEWEWNKRMAKAGGLKKIDAFSFHWYTPGPDYVAEEMYDQLKEILDRFSQLLKDHGPGRPVPFWNTECGEWDWTWLRGSPEYERRFPPDAMRGQYWHQVANHSIVEAAAIQQSLGIVRQFYYLQNGISREELGTCSMYEFTGAPRPKMMAYVAMAGQLDGTSCAGLVRRPEGRFWAVAYEKPEKQGSIIVWWVGDGGKVTLQAKWPGEVVKAVNIMGNPFTLATPPAVTGEPYYLHVSAPASAVMEALRTAEIAVVTPPLPLPQRTGPAPAELPGVPAYAKPEEGALFPIPLQKAANMGFADKKAGDGQGGWADEGPGYDLAGFPAGKRAYYNVPFDLIDPAANQDKAVISLCGRELTPTLPMAVKGLPVGNRRAKALVFLHAAAGITRCQETVGYYVVRYQDGSHADLPLTIGLNTDYWWHGRSPDEQSKPISVKVSDSGTGKRPWRFLRVWEWQNPRPDAPISGIDFVSTGGPATPILLGITGAQ